MRTLTISGWEKDIPADTGTLLDAALDEGAPVPYQCRSGECGECKCRLLEGQIEQQASLPAALNEAERKAGYILCCRSKARSDIRIAFDRPLCQPLPSIARHSATLLDKQLLTRDVLRVRLVLKAPLHFIAGQYVELRLPGLPARCYSLANGCDETVLELYIKVLPQGLVSQAIASQLQAGDRVQLRGPLGNACLNFVPDKPVLLVAGGTGLAPILAIARQLARDDTQQVAHCYFAVRRQEDAFALAELEALRQAMPHFRYQLIIAEPKRERCDHEVLAAIQADHATLAERYLFLAGSPTMVQAVKGGALALGADAQSIRCDPFNPAVSSRAREKPHWLAKLTSRLKRAS